MRPPRSVSSQAHPAEGASAASPVKALELLGIGTGLVLVAVLLGRMPSWRAELGTFQALYASSFAFFLLALFRLGRYARVPWAGAIVLAVAAAARLAVLPTAPSLSDDVYRYVWEGRVAAHGLSPYRLAPSAPELAFLRDDEIFPRINHPELATIYPPLAVAGFALVAALSPTVLAMKAWVVLHDLALVALLAAWLRRRGEGPAAALAYGWCPLAIVEFAGSGHNDPTAIVWMVAALAWRESRPMRSAAAVAAGALVKLAPLAALPYLLARWPARARWLALGALAAGLVSYAALTGGPSSGLGAYAKSWANNELIFHYLALAASDPALARLAAIALLGGIVAVFLVRGAPAEDATRGTLRAGFLLSPVAHPWYVAWCMALEPLGRSPSWWLLSLTCVLSYGLFAPPAEGGAFHLPLAWRWVEYGAPLLIGSALSWGRRSRG